MNKQILEKYAIIKQNIAKLESEAEMLRPDIVFAMQEANCGEVELENYGKFSLNHRRKWKFPEEVENIRKDLKEKEKESQQLGTATYEENTILVFSKNGDSKNTDQN